MLRVEHAPGDRPGVTIVRIRGEIDLATAPRLRAELRALTDAGCCDLEVDLAGVDLLDSTAIGVLLGALRRARLAGGNLRVTALEPSIAGLFDLLGLRPVFSAPGPAAPAASAAPSGARS
ncbi:MAG: STAS domain-containing protein [Acidimicrobiales bacterium]|nr:STAS domain-containing protein [Acidimicrobiales bacterium]